MKEDGWSMKGRRKLREEIQEERSSLAYPRVAADASLARGTLLRPGVAGL